MRGITPIISIIILLLITVSLAGAAYTFLQGFLFPQISKSFMVPTGGIYCSGGNIIVYVLNTGYQSNMVGSDFNIVAIDGTDFTGSVLTLDLAPGKAGKLLDTDDGVNPWTSGHHTVDIGTISGVQHLSVFCS